MNNLSVLVGRLVSDPEIKETKNGRKVCSITLAVTRSFKNPDGIYETDFIPVVLWNGISESVKEYCRKGDVIGIKGRLQKLDNEELKVIAEKVSFLSTAKSKEEV